MFHRARQQSAFPVAYVYFESKSGRRAAANMTKDEARKVAAGIAKLPELLLKSRDEKTPALAKLTPAP